MHVIGLNLIIFSFSKKKLSREGLKGRAYYLPIEFRSTEKLIDIRDSLKEFVVKTIIENERK